MGERTDVGPPGFGGRLCPGEAGEKDVLWEVRLVCGYLQVETDKQSSTCNLRIRIFVTFHLFFVTFMVNLATDFLFGL